MKLIQMKGINRNTIDKFYTKSEIVKKCINIVKENIIINKSDLIIEPSAGDGAFISSIKKLTNNYIFYDIEPENDEIICKDFLKIKTSFKNNVIHIIGNPPFGRQSSTARQFIKKSCDFCSTISFILPKSFKNEYMQRVFPKNFHLIKEIDLPDNAFLVNGKEHNVASIFQIWEKKNYSRNDIRKVKPLLFEFVKNTNNPDISIRRVGIYAGKIDLNIKKNKQTHYFIKLKNNKTLSENIKILSNIKYVFNNTGPRSISKQTIIKEFNKVL